eukprot:CAMPEP_0181227026 /NCGR_PEP_ID=MMETSP1096-20121128/32569_1 /TAXON_ID=156174 ORGANISM="Chrysochromulina ericina, Strain CCMP281" /NCGR_SAMPLE_ID=MMETSP1096 /ASSEMBLY_ACC=CAM_ASM_000453 /LENGTH=36 /DNA_ID= /DNA_START= /DNA_END= /DNA_ORIENTATION=
MTETTSEVEVTAMVVAKVMEETMGKEMDIQEEGAMG